MRVAFFSPLPPARSGIADYSAALIESLRPLIHLDVFSGDRDFDPALFDVALYQIGNNEHHGFAYEAALRHPGVVVLHEANLHHLVADRTIRRGDWDAYLEECERNGGPEARACAESVRRLERGPDYDGVKMLRRLLDGARAVIVHSRFMERELRACGYAGPVATIPHGARVIQADRHAYRRRLGLDELAPLMGIFGFLKPYKRIPESLRAFRRLVRLVPDARMILAGEPHPDLPLEPLIQSLRLSANVRVLGYTNIEDFTGYLGACDTVLNLRHPTVGETSGTLLRSLGLGRATLVSDVGSFAEFPDGVCARVPVGPGEEDSIFEYLNLFTSRPDVARALGSAARDYVARECTWNLVARRYAGFLEAICQGREWPAVESACQPIASQPAVAAPEKDPADLAGYLRGFAVTKESGDYFETHQTRLVKTVEMVPPGGPCDRILEMGAYLQITPALASRLGYGQVRGCYYGEPGRTDHRVATSRQGETFVCEIDHFDAEKDPFPYPDGHFSTVLCCELIEHLFADPMHLMCEVNRILNDGGRLLLTTPNLASLRAVAAVLQGYHPGFYPAYIRPTRAERETEARHNREYTPREIEMLLSNSGFRVERLETGEFLDLPHPEYAWVTHLLERYRLETGLRGDGIYALGRKTGPVKERYPEWLYS